MYDRDVLLISGLQVLDVYDVIEMFRSRVDGLGQGESYSVKISVGCLLNGKGVVADILLGGDRNGVDYAISGEIVDMVKTLRENGGGVVSRNIDNLFVFGGRMSVEVSLEIPHAC